MNNNNIEIRPAESIRPDGSIKLIRLPVALEYFGAPNPTELSAWCQGKNYEGIYPLRDIEEDGMPSDHILAAALWHARTKYPEATDLDICSYAGLVAYLATGWYGGFGTDQYQKERQAENIALAFAGGRPPAPGGIFAFEPATAPAPEFTVQLLSFLDMFYFSSPVDAVAGILGGVDVAVAARIVLALARTRDEYNALVLAADGFLKKKESISTLRKAVRDMLKK